jgi:hypothetical protein
VTPKIAKRTKQAKENLPSHNRSLKCLGCFFLSIPSNSYPSPSCTQSWPLILPTFLSEKFIETGHQVSSRKKNELVAKHPQSRLAWSASLNSLDHFNFQSNWFHNTLKRKYLDPSTTGLNPFCGTSPLHSLLCTWIQESQSIQILCVVLCCWGGVQLEDSSKKFR